MEIDRPVGHDEHMEAGPVDFRAVEDIVGAANVFENLSFIRRTDGGFAVREEDDCLDLIGAWALQAVQHGAQRRTYVGPAAPRRRGQRPLGCLTLIRRAEVTAEPQVRCRVERDY